MTDDRTDSELVNKLADLGTPHWLVVEVEARLAAVVRRVTPDRETLKAEAEKILKPHAFRYQDRAAARQLGISEVVSSAVPYWDAVNAVADALASGVLGVPADQPWANADTFQLHVTLDGDASNLIRIETLREAHAIISKRRGTYEAGIDLMERVAELEAVLGA